MKVYLISLAAGGVVGLLYSVMEVKIARAADRCAGRIARHARR